MHLLYMYNAIKIQYNEVIMSAMASQITNLTIVYSIIYSGAGQKKTWKLRVTGFCAGNSPVTGEFPAKRPITRQMSPFDDVIMYSTEINGVSASCAMVIPFIFNGMIHIACHCFVIQHYEQHFVSHNLHAASLGAAPPLEHFNMAHHLLAIEFRLVKHAHIRLGTRSSTTYATRLPQGVRANTSVWNDKHHLLSEVHRRVKL